MIRGFGTLDLGELAVRLKSIDIYDRRGNVVWWDDFEGTNLKWETNGTGTGWEVALNTASPFTGSQCVKLTTGDAVDDVAIISYNLAKPPLERLGIEYTFSSEVWLKYYEVGATIWTGSKRYDGQIRYDNNNDKLQYLNSSNSYTDFATNVKIAEELAAYYTIKFVIDLSAEKYVRCTFIDKSYDLSSYSLYSSSSSVSPRLTTMFRITAGDIDGRVCYVDNFILTQNEP